MGLGYLILQLVQGVQNALHAMINEQLRESDYRFYAIHGGNDLSGIFLTEREYEAARHSLASRKDWPYLPALEGPWYGQPH